MGDSARVIHEVADLKAWRSEVLRCARCVQKEDLVRMVSARSTKRKRQRRRAYTADRAPCSEWRAAKIRVQGNSSTWVERERGPVFGARRCWMELRQARMRRASTLGCCGAPTQLAPCTLQNSSFLVLGWDSSLR